MLLLAYWGARAIVLMWGSANKIDRMLDADVERVRRFLAA
jgi:hypothetical protein